MVGLPVNGPNMVCKPGRVSTPLLLNTTSWQSGETPCGNSDGDISVISPPKISMGASSDPAVVIWVSQVSAASKNGLIDHGLRQPDPRSRNGNAGRRSRGRY